MVAARTGLLFGALKGRLGEGVGRSSVEIHLESGVGARLFGATAAQERVSYISFDKLPSVPQCLSSCSVGPAPRPFDEGAEVDKGSI